MIKHTLYRAHIDQPSTLQPLHRMHGVNVIADPNSVKGNGGESITVALLDGPVITMTVPLMALAEGWTQSDNKLNKMADDIVDRLIDIGEAEPSVVEDAKAWVLGRLKKG